MMARVASPKVAWSALGASLLTVVIAALIQHVDDTNRISWPAGAKCTPAGACSCYIDHATNP